MGYTDERDQWTPEMAAVSAEDERLCRAHEAARTALDIIRVSYQCSNEELNRYGLPLLREEAWRVVAECLTRMRGCQVQIVAVAPRQRGRRCVQRFKVVRV
jgi:hypothetical protein